MQYNTQKSAIEIAEYGRNIQDLLLRANDIQNTEERLAYVEKVLDTMYIVNPQVRITEDYRSKLWSHAFRITDYTLDVTPPEGIVVDNQEDFFHKQPARVAYPVNLVKFRHYGKNITTLVKQAIATEDAEKRADFTMLIASFMKMAQINYNREGVSDEVIRRDLHELSGGRLTLDGEANIEDIARGNRVVLIEKVKTRRGKRGGKNKTKSASASNNTPAAPKNTAPTQQVRAPKNNTQNRPEKPQPATAKTPANKPLAAPIKAKKVIQEPKKTAIEPKKATNEPAKPANNPATNDAIGLTKKRRRGGRGRGGKGKKTGE
jgi:hypothetical protein